MRFSNVVLVTCFFTFSYTAFGQKVSFGILGGASLTQDFENESVGANPTLVAYSTPKRYIVGGMVEFGLPLHLSVEVDALYHELEYTNADIGPNGTLGSVSPAPVVTWEFPVLGIYRFPFEIVKPFIEVGPSFRASGNLNGTSPSTHGFTVGGGVEAHARRLKIRPQIRYLHWARDTKEAVLAPFTVQNQVELLVGFSF